MRYHVISARTGATIAVALSIHEARQAAREAGEPVNIIRR
jgi:hypothetical protein